MGGCLVVKVIIAVLGRQRLFLERLENANMMANHRMRALM